MSLQARILALFLALIVVVLAGTLATVSRVTYRHTLDRSADELAYARRIVLDKLASRESALAEAAGTLTKDDALRQAIFAGSEDPESILVALDNHRSRTNADLSLLVGLDGKILVDTGKPARRGSAFPFPELLGETSGGGPRIVIFDDAAYQIAAAPYYVPVSAPRPSLWLVLARAVDERLARELGGLIGVEIAFVATPAGDGEPTVLAASTNGPRRILEAAPPPESDGPAEIRTVSGSEFLAASAGLRALGGGRVAVLLVRSTSDALLDYRKLVGRFAWLALAAAILAAGGSRW